MGMRSEWIAQRRAQLDLSMRGAAASASINAATWSRAERGLSEPDRETLARMAVALRCRIADLCSPIAHRTAAEDERDGLLAALVETDPGLPPVAQAAPAAQLAAEADRIDRAYAAGAFTEAAVALAGHLRLLHATAHTGPGPNRTAATASGAQAAFLAMQLLAKLGARAEAVVAAERCERLAQASGRPVLIGRAAFARAHAAAATGAAACALALTEAGLDALDAHLEATGVQAAAGQLHLTAARLLTGQSRLRAAADRIDAAAALAQRTGNLGFDYGWFGPVNVGIWRVGLEADHGDPARAIAQAATVNLAALPAPTRRAAHRIDLAGAAAALGDADRALAHLAAADRAAPELVAHSRRARRTVTALTRQPPANPTAAPALALLADRVGA